MSHPDSAPRRGAHRGARGLHRPAALLTTVIASASVALAAFAATGPSATLDARHVEASLSTAGPVIGAEAVGQVATTVQQPEAEGTIRLDQLVLARGVVADSAAAGEAATRAVQKRSKEIAAERAEARRKAEEEAQRKAEEEAQRKAEEEARRQAEAEAQAAAEAAAAAEAEAAAETERQEEAEQAASRSTERESAPAPSGDPRSIARSMLSGYGWSDDQWGCLDSLWQKESGWNTYAENPSSGAYGIPQALPGSKMASAGGDWASNPATQIRWGLGYISGRYGSPCGAWSHSQSVGWY